MKPDQLHPYCSQGQLAECQTTLNEIGGVYDGLGDWQQALTCHEQALPIRREVGDRAVEATARYNIAMIHRAEGNLDEAIGELELVVDLDRQVDHPDVASDIATLEQFRQERAGAEEAT
ncbi:tetratricopeptide repeat protein [Micromonospora sp. LOL_023]|uniref:tetratricopeptide repeat protein n=1 Tax=Micromonospora sp. LOL_023 TaxID=3345418 RepID=UPI003A89FBDB